MPHGFFRVSGGALYHLRAQRQSRLWRSFRDSLATWLEAWPAPRGRLILIGPSGGYTLPSKWLRSFAEVVAYDVDPLAPWLFALRHPGLRVKFHKQDMFWKNGALSTEALRSLRKEFPGAAILFCNVLGQIPLEGQVTEVQWLDFLTELRLTLSRAAWASYHDLYTLEPLPQTAHGALTDNYVATRDIARAARSGLTAALAVTDHLLAGEWTKNTLRTVIPWSLTPTSLHIIEGIFPEDAKP